MVAVAEISAMKIPCSARTINKLYILALMSKINTSTVVPRRKILHHFFFTKKRLRWLVGIKAKARNPVVKDTASELMAEQR